MEYMTVLKRSEYAGDLKTAELGALPGQRPGQLRQATWGARLTSGRLCSQALFICVMLILMLLMFTSQLLVHVQLKNLSGEVNVNKAKVDDMLEAAQLEKYLNEERIRAEKKKDLQKKDKHNGRRTRDGTNNLPVYFILRGSNRVSGDGIFKWNKDHANSFMSRSGFEIVGSPSSQTEKLRVTVSGLYMVTVKINVKGRRHTSSIHGPVGFWICKKSTYSNNTLSPENILDKVFVTQDDRGEIRMVRGGQAEDAPVDSIVYSGLLFLAQNDYVYVRRPEETINDNTIIYDNGAESAHFTAILTARDG